MGTSRRTTRLLPHTHSLLAARSSTLSQRRPHLTSDRRRHNQLVAVDQRPCLRDRALSAKSGRGSEFGGAHGNGRGRHLMSLFSLFQLSVKEEDVQTEKADNKPTGRMTHSFEPTGRRTMETEDPDADEIVMFLTQSAQVSLVLLKSLANVMTLETACLMAYCIVLNLKAMWLQSTETKNTDSVQKKKVEEEWEEEALAFTTVETLLDEKGTPLKEDPERVAQVKLAQTKPYDVCLIRFFHLDGCHTPRRHFVRSVHLDAVDEVSPSVVSVSVAHRRDVRLQKHESQLAIVQRNTIPHSDTSSSTPAVHTLVAHPLPLLPSLLLFCTQFNHTRSHLSKVEADTRALWTADTQNTLTLFLNRVFSNYTERMSQTQLVPFVSFQKDFEWALK
ncbi:hypothetical protein BLNAU_19756 [Blattamonas nauphoetae]|uniref:Uncharacterized protein n=1 Tax=Blattamonas nauphoetae TaxID=2049346 RepID=A0ABQ9X166_9EUKA|nr:hypothetical protein BLNAU_19756 [Blattamonas nauphoetae]